MPLKDTTQSTLAAAATVLGATASLAADKPSTDKAAFDKAALDKAFQKLTSYKWGTDPKSLAPITDAVTATHGDEAARKELEARLVAVLISGAPRAAKDFVCRKLTVIGTAESVPALAGLLPDKDLSHMSRYALERIPAAEAAQALRDALPKLSGKLKIGVIGSLGVRRDEPSTSALAALVCDGDAAVACAAANALGDIGTADAAKALQESWKSAAKGVKPMLADACLAIAERLLAEGDKAAAVKIYKSLMSADAPKNVRLAATRGLLLASGK